jgi:hypothetical protein
MEQRKWNDVQSAVRADQEMLSEKRPNSIRQEHSGQFLDLRSTPLFGETLPSLSGSVLDTLTTREVIGGNPVTVDDPEKAFAIAQAVGQERGIRIQQFPLDLGKLPALSSRLSGDVVQQRS